MRSVTSICWKKTASSNELVLAIGREDGSIAIHDLRDKEDENLVVLRDHVSAVTCMSWSPDNTDLFVTSGRDAVINLWKSSTVVADDEGSSPKKSKKKKNKKKAPVAPAAGRIVYQRIHTKPVYEQVEGMVVLKTSKAQSLLVATAGSMGNVKLWNYNNSKQALECIAEQPAAQRFGNLKGGYMDLKLQSMEDGKEDAEREEQLVVADAEHNLLFLSLSGEKKLATTRTIVGHNDEILDLKILPNGDEASTHAVVATNSAQVRLFNLGTFSCEILDGHSATVLCVDVSPCGRYISTCGKDKTMRIWQTSTCKSVAVATGHTEAIGATALSRKAGRYNVSGKAAVNGGGSFALTASKDRTLKRWNLPGSSVLDDDSAKSFE
jgi:U3 small nucleolar RNA-associated protein 13